MTPWTVACQVLLLCPWNFLGKNTGMGSHSLPGDPLNSGIKPGFPATQADSSLSEPGGKAKDPPR